MKKEELFSTSFHAGSRTYFFDVKNTVEGYKYLKISESKRIGDNEFERHQIMIFEEDIEKFVSAFSEASNVFKHSEKAYSVANLRKINPNAYKPWAKEEDEKLELLFCEGKRVGELSVIFGRNRGAITSRIKKLELKEKYGR